MTGALFAVVGSVCFAFNSITTRRAVAIVSNAAIGIFITVPLAVPFFLLVLLGMGRVDKIFAFPLQGYVFLVAAGIVHYGLGRPLNYKCTQLLGSNVRGVLSKLAPLVASALGIILFHEPVTWKLLSGIALIVAGLLVIGWGRAMSKDSLPGGKPGLPLAGIFYGLASGVFWGISPILIKKGLEGGGDPTAAALISYAGATAAMLPFLLARGMREELTGMGRKAFLWFLVTTVLVALAHLFRFIALSKAPVSVVAPLFSIDPVIVIVLSFIFNRRLEIFSWQVIAGALTTAVGAVLLI